MDRGVIDTPRPDLPALRALPSRRVSGMERLWLVSDRMCPPFANQMVLEGDGVPAPDDGWDAALQRVVAAQPAARARLHGVLGGSRWVADGPGPSVEVHEALGWDGRGPDGAAFLARSIDPRRGPTTELHILPGEPARMVIRTHHALMDGQGAMLLARAVFAALRGEEPPTAALGPLNDGALARALGVRAEPVQPHRFHAHTAAAGAAPFGVTWGRVRVEGRISALLPRVAVALARMADAGEERPYRVAVPVDMRRHRPGLVSSANLTGMVRLDVGTLLGEPDPVAATRQALRAAMAAGDEGRVVRAAAIGRWVPLGLMAWIGARGARTSLRKGRYPGSAVLSNLGRLDLGAFSGGGFQARRCFFIPPGNPGLPLFLATSGDAEGGEICACVPLALAADGRLGALLGELRAALRGR